MKKDRSEKKVRLGNAQLYLDTGKAVVFLCVNFLTVFLDIMVYYSNLLYYRYNSNDVT